MTAISPLRYPGGKTRAIQCLLERFHEIDRSPEGTSPDMTQRGTFASGNGVLVSPFFGGGSFELATNAHQIFANDIFDPLYNFWQQLKTNRDALVAKVREIKSADFTKQRFIDARAVFSNDHAPETPIDRAALYFAINRSSFSGATFCGGYSRQSAIARFTASSIERLERVDLSRVTFSNEDFEPFIFRMVREQPQSIMFLDPPYYIDSYLYGRNGDLHQAFDHARLRDVLVRISSQTDHKWVMTYNDCEFIRELYDDVELFSIEEVSWSYGMNASKKSSEIIIVPPRFASVADPDSAIEAEIDLARQGIANLR